MKKLYLFFALLAFSSCAHSVHEVYVSDFDSGLPMKDGVLVSSNSEQFVVLGFTGNTDYVNKAYVSLIQSCRGGNISGITTQYSTSLGFLSWTNKILMQGMCFK